eukprot:TRINITY_DN31276_c0_g1_i1.p1 TRINITY_DN31276_c0_g1~~TRINITY_DN31276_c0_g1_i1.p1  ORF type:complete len:269 (+),score=66.38 TRINITY_DN31276_c0_g1_i1:41-847(+)
MAGVSINLPRFSFDAKKTKSNTLVITNNCDKAIAYKLKTSSPPRYAVKPHMGFIEAGTTKAVTVSLRVTTDSERPMPLPINRDKFQLEARELTNQENNARIASSKDDAAGVKMCLGIEEDVDILQWLWKNIPRGSFVKKFVLEVAYNTDISNPAEEEFVTPKRTTETTDALHTAVDTKIAGATASPHLASQAERIQNENAKLKAELAALEQRKNDLKMKSKEYEAASDELRSKAEKSGMTIPGWLFMILFLACFYMGLVFDKFYSVEN